MFILLYCNNHQLKKMLFTTQKKGSERLNNTIISLIIVAVGIVILINISLNLDSEAKFLLDFYSHDLSMTIEAVQGVPGDIELFYPLEEGYRAILNQGEVRMIHLYTGRTDSESFHLIPKHEIEESSAEKYITITKRDGIISFSGEKKAKINSCPSHTGLASNDFSVAVIQGSADAASPFNKEHLTLFTASVEFALEKEKLSAQTTPTITFIISSEQPQDEFDFIVIRRPKGDSIQEQNYQFLYCELFKQFSAAGFSVKEEIIPGNHYNIEIVIKIHQDKVEEFVKGRASFAKGIVSILTPLKQEVTP